jgi:hypothetical protein
VILMRTPLFPKSRRHSRAKAPRSRKSDAPSNSNMRSCALSPAAMRISSP